VAGAPRRSRGSHRRAVRTVVRVAVIVAAAWFVTVSALLLVAWLYARAGFAHVEHATQTLAPEDLVVRDKLGPLRAARNDLAVAKAATGFPLVRALGPVPYVGRQVRAAHSLGSAAHDVLDAGVDSIETSQRGIAGFKRGGPARVAGMRLLASTAHSSQTRIDRIDLGPSTGLVAPLAHAHREFARRLPKLTRALGDLDTAATGLAEFLDGPRLYMLFAANNNEMRLGSGAFLSGSLLYTSHGEMTLFPPRPTAIMRLGPLLAATVPMETDQKFVWGWLAPNDEWRNLGASPRFDTTADLARRMLAARDHLAIDGVLALDPVALEQLGRATGPMRVGKRSLAGEKLLRYLLVDQYRGLSSTEFGSTAQQTRRDALGTLAKQAVDRLNAGDWDTRNLVRALRGAARDRHVLAWSRHPDEQRAWRVAEIDGRLSRNSLLVGLHNRGGNKLDPFIGIDNTLRTRPVKNGTDVSLTVSVGNVAPAGLPGYVAGPYPGAINGARNLYQGILTVYVPDAAVGVDVVRTSGAEPARIVAAGTDGRSRVVGVQVRIPRGGHDELRFTFHLPKRVDRLVVEPSARQPTEHWELARVAWLRTTWEDTERHLVRLR
jgi:hypothetical protein